MAKMMFSFYFSIEYKHAITVEVRSFSLQKVLITKGRDQIKSVN